MKTLKFMLAAATAIGLASASYAKLGALDGSIDFEGTDPLASGFVFTGAEGDNDSEVVAPGANSTGHALKVSVGTDPLLRALSTLGNPNGDAIPLAGDGSYEEVTIDTMVQFTVTPYSDPVTANASDKLMIYLKEMTNGVGEVTGTNLVVKAAKYTPENPRTSVPASFDATDVEVNGVSVVPGQWYNLKVKALKDSDNVVYFNIWINDTQLSGVDSLYGDAENYNFPSLLGNTSTTLTYVGFAGEGMVDELVFTTEDGVTAVDFTFTLNPNVTSVTYTINDGTAQTVSATTTVPVYPADTVKITNVAYAPGYVAAAGSPAATDVTGDFTNGYVVGSGNGSLAFSAAQEVTTVSFTLNLTQPGVNSVSFTVDGTTYNVTTATTNLTLNPGTVNYTATFDTANWWTGTNGSFTVAANGSHTVEATRENAAGVITSTTTAADLGITTTAFANSDSTELAKVVDWAVRSGKTTTEVNAMTFANALNYSADEKSYLLDGTNKTEAEAAEALKITAITQDENGNWVITPGVQTLGNGRVEIWGSATLNGTFAPKAAGNQFFKAVLVK